MADQRDDIAQALMNQNTGGLTLGDFTTFSNKVSPEELKGWLDKGGIYGQMGLTPPDPDEQYFGNRGLPSGSTPETSWMASIQPWQQGGQGGGETSYQSQQMIQPGFVGAGSAMRADPAYWGYQGRGQGYAPGSMGDVSGFNAGRGSAGGTGGLTPSDFATFSRLVGPQALQDWLNAGGVQGQFGGGMGGAVGGGGGGGGGVGGGGGQGPGSGGGSGRGGGNTANVGNVAQGQSPSSNNSVGYTYGPPGTPSADGLNSVNSTGAGVIGGFGPNGFGIGNTSSYSGQVGFTPGYSGMTMGTPGQGTDDGWGYGASQGDPSGSGAW